MSRKDIERRRFRVKSQNRLGRLATTVARAETSSATVARAAATHKRLM